MFIKKNVNVSVLPEGSENSIPLTGEDVRIVLSDLRNAIQSEGILINNGKSNVNSYNNYAYIIFNLMSYNKVKIKYGVKGKYLIYGIAIGSDKIDQDKWCNISTIDMKPISNSNTAKLLYVRQGEAVNEEIIEIEVPISSEYPYLKVFFNCEEPNSFVKLYPLEEVKEQIIPIPTKASIFGGFTKFAIPVAIVGLLGVFFSKKK